KILILIEVYMISDPISMQLFKEAGKKYFDGLWSESKKLLEEAISIDPKFAMAYRNLGILHHDLGNPEESAKYLSKALELGDEFTSELWRMVGDSLFMINKFKEAVEALDKAILLDEKNINARYWLALSYIKLFKLTDDVQFRTAAQEQ